MTNQQYRKVENYMLQCMEDSAHDREHVYRVLNTALQLAQQAPEANLDLIICACLLHDIGRKEQFADASVCHAQVGAQKAYRFLLEEGFDEDFARAAAHCIKAHRFRTGEAPQSVEARILFDADKLDAVGATGIARTLMYAGQVGAPLYTRREDISISDGTGESTPSFFREYKFKLEKLYDLFYTDSGRALAARRKRSAEAFYQAVLGEVRESHEAGAAILKAMFREEEEA